MKSLTGHHIHCTQIKVNTFLRQLRQLIHSKPILTLNTKLNLYEILLKPIRTVNRFGDPQKKPPNLNMIQISQNIPLSHERSILYHKSNLTLRPTNKDNRINRLNTCHNIKNHPNILVKDFTPFNNSFF